MLPVAAAAGAVLPEGASRLRSRAGPSARQGAEVVCVLCGPYVLPPPAYGVEWGLVVNPPFQGGGMSYVVI